MFSAPVYISAKQIAGIKAACLAGREALDLAAAACKPGVTTDEIDRVVSPCPQPSIYRCLLTSILPCMKDLIDWKSDMG